MIFVWHVIRKQLVWSYIAKPIHLAVTKHGRFAIVNASPDRTGNFVIFPYLHSPDDRIVLFNASDPKPLHVFKTEGGVEVI